MTEAALNQHIGFLQEANENIDPFIGGNSTTPWYNFGAHTRTWGDFPIKRSKLMSLYAGSSFDPYKLTEASHEVLSAISYIPTNGLGLYHALCGHTGGSSTTSEIHTLTPSTPLSNPEQTSRTLRYRSSAGSSDVIRHVTGNKLLSLGLSIDIADILNPMAANEVLQGRQLAAPVAGTTGVSTGLILPDSESGQYKFNNNFSFLWGSGTTKDYGSAGELQGAAFTFENFNSLQYVDNQKFPNWVKRGNRTLGINADILRTDTTNNDLMEADYFAQTPDDTLNNLTFKIYNGTDKYIQLVYTDVFIIELKMNHAYLQNNEPAKYSMSAIARTVTPTIKDGLTEGTHYGEA